MNRDEPVNRKGEGRAEGVPERGMPEAPGEGEEKAKGEGDRFGGGIMVAWRATGDELPGDTQGG